MDNLSTNLNQEMSRKEIFILAGFVILKFILQYFLIHPDYDLHRDEYLHLDQANHLAWGYMSIPPVTSWFSYLIKSLGNTVFWIKFFPALFGALTMVLVWKTCHILKGNLYAKILGASCILFSLLLRLNSLYQPNSLDVLCWTATFFFFISYIQTERSKWIYWTAVVFAFGFLNKYNIVFLILGLFPALLLTKQRSLFLKKDPYLAIALAFILILPNLIWQYKNSFPVLYHMRLLADSQLIYVQRTLFLKEQLYFFTGALIVIISALYALLFSKTFRKYNFLFWAFIFTLAIYTYLKAKGYYAIGLYPICIAIGSVYLVQILNNKVGKLIQLLLIALPILVVILTMDVAFPNRSPAYIIQHQDRYKKLGLLRWEDGKDHEIPQDYADMLGWSELATKVDQAYLHIKDPQHTLVLCDSYGQAGAINYYTKHNIRAVSFDADYVNWFDLQNKYTNLIRIKYKKERKKELIETSPYFNSSVIHDSITHPFSREFGTTIFIFKGAKININERILEELEQKKNHN